MAHPELAAEQAHVDHAYARLAAMRDSANGMLQEALGERGGTFQSFTERDIRVRTSLGRLEHLQIGDEALVFGRIDAAGGPAGGGSAGDGSDGDGWAGDGSGGDGSAGGGSGGEAYHIGRLAISDADQEPLVVDWRAPVVEPFYRATGAHPMGLRRRRHFLTDGRRLLDLEDELFDVEGSDEGVGLGLSGSQVLLAALSRARTGRMRDIVATVQREQDEIIRSPLGGVQVVQGGPGTGKTAVALHRAAYLLYTHRFPLETQGVLVVGPNPTYLRYIGHVLPSLGESGVELSTITGLYAHARPRPGATEDPATTRVKGDRRMARVIARAVADRQRPLRRTVEIPYGRANLRLSAEASAGIVAAAKRRPGTHNARRRSVEALLWRHLLEEVARRIPAGLHHVDGDDVELEGVPDPEPLTAAELGSELRRDPEVVAALDRMWPILTAEELLHDLFGAAPLVELAARSHLSEPERALLLRPRSGALAEVAWTAADVPLLDEARALLGPPRRRSAPDEAEDIRRYGHIVVDEAQDLSPMQLRMLARRSLGGSMTVVGDIAQATGAWAPATWAEVAAHLPGDRGWRQVELTVNYRTPTEIMDLAARVLAVAAPGMVAPDAVRVVGEPVRYVLARCGPAPDGAAGGERPGATSGGAAGGVRPGPPPFPPPPPPPGQQSLFAPATGPTDGQVVPPVLQPSGADLPGAVVATTLSELDALAGGEGGDGRVAVIAPPSMLDTLAAALRDAGVDAGNGRDAGLEGRATLLAVEDAKGLEFDAVVVVEPEAMTRESAQGLRAVYVALTRATRRLAVVHAGTLPAPMRPD